MGKCISILGSTGSIGTQSLEVAKAHDMQVHALAANRNITLLEQQTREYHAKKVCIFEESQYQELKQRLADLPVQVLCGMDGLCDIAADKNADILINSVVGMVGLLPTLTAISAGMDVALANKETLVAGGSLVMEQAARKGVHIYPVDSEHSAIFQCLQGNRREQLNKIILTASGGPFFGKTRAELENVTVADALNHPNWSMGNKITIDSATLMNKGLEFIEAKWLFDLTPDQIEIVVHRQSVVHSAVEYQDCSVIAQLGVPDMKIPIQYALLYPERMPCPTKHLSLTDYGTLTFEKPDMETFTCLKTAIAAITAGGTAPCIVNGANEVAVAAFLAGKIGFLEIGALAQQAMESIPATVIKTYEDVMKADTQAREFVRNAIA
ncbi:1-deoxy-D-xylulose-5-phosphate reductoisomerase [Ruminococcus sp.]|uniref:1-deoxy-D-xylulose-5-phosphate reductoisomerase n=1 Tax=Ruminococcus sp. TaxID=41978 RepID=UPI003FD7E38F